MGADGVGAGRADADFENVENADHDVFSLNVGCLCGGMRMLSVCRVV